MCLYSHYPALLGKHQRQPAWCTLWRRRILDRRMTEARQVRCRLRPQCSWKTSQKDTSLKRQISVNLRRQNVPPSPNSTNTAVLTEVNIQQGSVGSLHQDFLARSSESFVHEVDAISHQWTQSLCVCLNKQQNQQILTPPLCNLKSSTYQKMEI